MKQRPLPSDLCIWSPIDLGWKVGEELSTDFGTHTPRYSRVVSVDPQADGTVKYQVTDAYPGTPKEPNP